MRLMSKIMAISLIVFMLGKNAYGMEDDVLDTSQKQQASCIESNSLEKDLKEIEAEIYQRLVVSQIDYDGIWTLLAGCCQTYSGIKACRNDHMILATWVLQMAVRYRLPLIIKLILMFPEAKMLSVELVRDFLYFMASSRNKVFPRAIKIRIFYQLIKLPQVKEFTECQLAEVANNLLDEKTINVNALQAIFSHFSNFFTPAS
jgi:hypothetical protein